MKIKAKEKNIRKKNYMEVKTLQSTKASTTKEATKHMIDLFRPKRLDKADMRIVYRLEAIKPEPLISKLNIARTYFIY